MDFDWIKIILALLLFWPRGYVLVYLIDRSKSMGFGFKFFAGWLLGLAGFTLDIFAAVAIGGLELSWLVFLNSSVSQIFGFSLMIFLFERRILYPNFKNFYPFILKQLNNFKSWSRREQAFLSLLFLIVIFVSAIHFSIGLALPLTQIDFSKIIQSNSTALSPLNDALLKVWLLEIGGGLSSQASGLVWIFYYLLLLGFFYHLLSPTIKRSSRLLATCWVAVFSSVYLNSNVSDINLYFSIFVLMAIGSLYYFIVQRGLSFYYLAGMGLAFAVWTKNDSLILLLPMMVTATIILFLSKKVSLKDFWLQWFFTILTVVPWIFFVLMNHFTIFPSGQDLTFSVLVVQFLPTLILFLTILFAKVNVYAKT